ncbi:hypothetical protein [Bartonella sp. DGB2]
MSYRTRVTCDVTTAHKLSLIAQPYGGIRALYLIDWVFQIFW